MWVIGIFIFAYLLLFNDATNKINTPPEMSILAIIKDSNINNDKELTNNDAYVFINVNKKHFLTRFVASVLPENLDVLENKEKKIQPTTITPSVEKVYKKSSVGINKTPSSGFDIKPVPKI
jgi:c-di-GMP-related signal transduction protein